ncbi:helix-turn-helix domain-containing protein [Flavivirga algicola]|uniref:AraC family transcriptional regulator n=1 Tax=Flavivirga algicola TaxID=2729136 RepID=A0ABX1RZ14_9FLAO|nr:helix-turn-helix domain-containing protein [Flavivirga algicola]NMH88812.1 AraC family transcriptional regulator [Flavivirga algicola]
MISNNVIFILASLGLFQGTILSIYLLTLKTGNRKLNTYLAIVLFGLTIRIGKSVFGYYTSLEAWQRNIGLSGIFVVGPFLWFYGIELLEKRHILYRWNYLHLLPFLLFILLLAVIPSTGKYEAYWNYGLVIFHLAIYLVLSWMVLKRNTAKSSKKKVYWYRNILIGVTFVWVYYLGNFLSFKLYYIWGPIFYTFLIYAFSYLFLNRNSFNLDKYGSSNLDSNSSKVLFEKIQKLFVDEHIFLIPNVSLKIVSEKLGVSSREVSQAINENEQQNFYEFVNRFRIEKAKYLLADLKYKDEKIATIAFDSGFGTVTAFNVAFKKHTEMTPSAYRKQHL